MSKPDLGIIGGGQLGSLLASAAKKLNIKTVILSDDKDAPAINFADEFIFFILLFLLTLNSSLIFGFSIYFIFFHSVLSIKDQVKYIYGDDNSQYIKKYLISALPYFILALLFLIGSYLFIDFESLDILPIMFTFLAAITFPHVIVIEKMYSSMK